MNDKWKVKLRPMSEAPRSTNGKSDRPILAATRSDVFGVQWWIVRSDGGDTWFSEDAMWVASEFLGWTELPEVEE